MEIIAQTRERSITQEDVEKIVNLDNFLNDLEMERETTLALSWNIRHKHHINIIKGPGFKQVRMMLKKIGFKEDDIILENSSTLMKCFYKGKQHEDKYYFFYLKDNYPILVFNRQHLGFIGHAVDSYSEEDFIEFLKTIPEALDRWEEEDKIIRRIWEIHEKMRKIAQVSIRAIVDNELKDKNLEYALVNERDRCILTLKNSNARTVRLCINNDEVQKYAGHLLDMIEKQ